VVSDIMISCGSPTSGNYVIIHSRWRLSSAGEHDSRRSS